jgi:microcystin-dependent protein
MSQPFIGEIRIFGFNFAPRGWAFCNGQLLAIAQNTALFSLLGTTYGGNGQTTFALPNLQSRVPVHFGQGPGLSSYALGQEAGSESVTLIQNEIPAHVHTVSPSCSTDDPNAGSPKNNFPAAAGTPIYSNTSNAVMGVSNTSIVGGSQPHNNIQPYLALNFCIALQGIFPSRN